VALVLALMVEEDKPRAVLSVPTESRAPRPARGPVELRPASSVRSYGALSASWGLLPAAGLGPNFGFDVLLFPSVSLQADGSAWVSVGPPAGKGGRFWAWQAGAGLCPDLAAGEAVNVSACAGTQWGIMYGTGSGLDYNLSTRRPIMLADARVRGSVTLAGPLSLLATIGVGVPWIRPRFVYLEPSAPSHEVHRPSPVVAFGGLGLELRTVGSAPP
jgi:hypothetical protein